MREIVWRHDPAAGYHERQPQTVAGARDRLDRGNAAFAELGRSGGSHVIAVGPEAFGLPRAEGAGLAQEPFAAVLGCSDARVPVELVFGQAANDLFVVRVAGNVPGTECLGSLHYAVQNLSTLRLIVVLGHTRCGAVTAAVDALLVPETYLRVVHDPELRAIVDALLAGVRMAALALGEVHGASVVDAAGYRDALVETAVVANAAVTAAVLDRAIEPDVVFGVFDLEQRMVGASGPSGWMPGLADPPADDQALGALLRAHAAAAVLG